MGRDLRSLRIDRQQATRLGAMIGLGLLGISVLPGMLKSPEPPPVPPDVGFRPGELAGIAEIPQPSTSRRIQKKKKRSMAASDRDYTERNRKRPRTEDREKKRVRRKERPKEAPDLSASATVSVPAPVVASPAPPAPLPASPDAVQTHPADGSQEFAPR